eukprot:gene27675-36429_t
MAQGGRGIGGDGDANIIALLLRQMKALKISHEKKGISTAAEWVTSLRAEGSLAVNSVGLNTFLEGLAVTSWPTAGVAAFPPDDATETATCLPFVTARINEATKRVDFRSVPVNGHDVISFSGRSPDIPCYNGERRGGCSITLLGDVKGCGSRTNDFPEAEVGHILDMGTDLMNKEQFTRKFLFCFLTDGYRFQFFRCVRSQHGDVFSYEQSAVYGGEHGWQIFFGLLNSPVEDLGFVTFDIPNWELLDGLGKGKFSYAFTCRSSLTNEVVALKVFQAHTAHMAFTERTVLTSLNAAGISNVPVFRELHICDGFNALMLTPIGEPVLPCPAHADLTPTMIAILLETVQEAHSLNWIHRDIKPELFLIDWSSAARANIECDFIGTRIFGDAPNAYNRHTPDPSLDLRCLVKTVYCLSKQRMPVVRENAADVHEYWARVKYQVPLFRKAMGLADAVKYDELADLFMNVW